MAVLRPAGRQEGAGAGTPHVRKGFFVDFEIKDSKIEDGVLTLAVEVGAEAVEEAFSKVRRELARYVRIPGFRKGKAPLSVLANHIGRDRFQHEVERELLPRYYYRALEEQGSRPVSAVTYEEKTLETGKPFTFVAKVNVAPEVELGDYSSTTVEAPAPAAVSDEDLDARVQDLRTRAASTKAKDGPAAEGDMVMMKVEGKVGDQEFRSLTRKNLTVRLGQDEFFPGFDAEIVGLGKGDDKNFSLPAPADTENENLTGKTCEFKVKVKSVKTVELPELDDDFFGKLAGGISSEEDLRGRLRAELERDAKKKADEAYDLALHEMLLELVDVNPPDSMVDQRVVERLAEFKEQFTGGYSFSDYLKEWNRSEEDVKDELREGAVKQIKVELALDEIARRQDLEASDEEVTERLRTIARLMRRSPMDVEEMVDSSGSRILKKQELTREKAFNWLRTRHLRDGA